MPVIFFSSISVYTITNKHPAFLTITPQLKQSTHFVYSYKCQISALLNIVKQSGEAFKHTET